MRSKIIFFCLSIFLLTTCQDQTDIIQCPPGNDPYGNKPYGGVLSVSDCKSEAGIITEEFSNSDECMSYQYFPSDKILYLKHINGAFNCYPGNITSEISFDGNNIVLKEKQSEAGARCDCLYDLSYDLRNINPEVYLVSISGPIIDGINFPSFSFYIDLSNNTSGSFSVYRGFYPWSE